MKGIPKKNGGLSTSESLETLEDKIRSFSEGPL
jgi:hypothetical protein